MDVDPACPICGVVAAVPPVYRDEHWHACVLPTIEVPGWLGLQLRRHAEQATGMNDEESRTFGPVLVRLSAAIKRATDAERVYVYSFGDTSAHWHVLLAARGADVPPEHWRGHFYEQRARYRDVPRADLVAEQIRLALDAG